MGRTGKKLWQKISESTEGSAQESANKNVKSLPLNQWFSKSVPGAAAEAYLGIVLAMQILSPVPTNSEWLERYY